MVSQVDQSIHSVRLLSTPISEYSASFSTSATSGFFSRYCGEQTGKMVSPNSKRASYPGQLPSPRRIVNVTSSPRHSSSISDDKSLIFKSSFSALNRARRGISQRPATECVAASVTVRVAFSTCTLFDIVRNSSSRGATSL